VENWIASNTEIVSGLIGAFLGASASLAATWLQLSHAQKENRTQREMEMRKQIYFDAYESAVYMQTALASLPQADLKNMSVDPKISAALDKLHAVAGVELIQNVTDFQQHISESIFKIAPMKIVCEGVQNKINHSNNMHQIYLEQHKEWTEQMKNAVDEESLANMVKITEDLQVKMEKCRDYADEESEKLTVLQINLLEAALNQLPKGREILISCNILIRKELGMGFSDEDLNKYQDMSKKSMESTDKALKSYLSEGRDLLVNDEFPDFT